MDLPRGAILILDRDYFPLLYRFRAEHPEVFFRLLSPEDIRSRLGVNFVSSPLPYLMKQGLDYDSAKKWMRILSFDVASEHSGVESLLESIPSEIIRKDDLGIYELSKAPLFLVELQEDVEIHALLTRNGLSAKDVGLTDLGIKPVTELKGLNVTLFQNKYEQFDAVFSSLRERYALKQKEDGEVKANDVRLFVQGEGDAFYLDLIGKEFGIPVQMDIGAPLYAEEGVSDLCDNLYQRESMTLSEEEKATPQGTIIQGIIEEFSLFELPFQLAYLSLFEILQSRKVTRSLSPSGVIASSSSVFSPEKEIYLTCLQHGPFYTIYSDDDVLSDAELLSLGLNPSYVKTQLERRKKQNYLAYHRFALLSRVKQHLDEKIYPSGFAEEFEWEKISPLASGVYSADSAKNRIMTDIDRAFYSQPIGEYRGYDSSFKGIKDYRFPKPTFSITNLESYRSCPYRYYLNSVLPKAKRDYRPSFVGTMIHKALENIYSDDYDLEKALGEARLAYLCERDNAKLDPSPFDDVLIEATIASLRRMLPLVEAQKNVAKISEQWSEERFSFTLKDERGEYTFRGAIDNILRFEVGQAHYLVINDYKSGAERYHPYEGFLGGSTQLPIYYYALLHGKQSNSKNSEPLLQRFPSIFAGMGIKPVSSRSLLTMFLDRDKGVLTLEKGYQSLASSGVYLNDPSFWAAVDPTYKSNQFGVKGRFFIAGKTTFDASGEGKLSGIPGARPYGLDELVNDAVKGTLDVIHSILEADFPIAPTSSDLHVAPESRNLTCSYCPYRDICYRNLARDVKDYSKAIEENFMEGGDSHAI